MGFIFLLPFFNLFLFPLLEPFAPKDPDFINKASYLALAFFSVFSA